MQEDGTVNPAFVTNSQPEEGLIPFYRLRSLDSPGVYLFATLEKYQTLVAEDSARQEQWVVEGLDREGNDIAEFYLLPPGSGVGEPFDRCRNTHNGGFLFVGESESAAIASNPDLSNVFFSEGEAFESFV